MGWTARSIGTVGLYAILAIGGSRGAAEGGEGWLDIELSSEAIPGLNRLPVIEGEPGGEAVFEAALLLGTRDFSTGVQG